MPATVIKLLQVAAIRQRQGSAVAQRVILPGQFALPNLLGIRQGQMLRHFTQLSPTAVVAVYSMYS
ncbi:hypothetical protein IU46_008210 [Pantoea agglomerans]|nr:hypothetical protein IU46_008210 [Pantoea agglomerans]